MLPYIEIFDRSYPMYGICIVVGLFVAALFMIYDCNKNDVLWENAVIIGIMGVVCGFIGAKILYVLVTYTPAEIIEIIEYEEYETILSGGFVFYGGLITGILGTLLGTKLVKAKLIDYERVLIKVIPLVHGFGRLGCFCAGCCYGKPTDSPLYVAFEEPISDAPMGVPLVPVQLYESGFNFLLFFLLCFLDRKTDGRLLLPLYVILYGAERFIIEFFRYDEIRGIYFGLSTSQWISIGMCIGGMIIFLFRKVKKVQNNV